MPNSTPQPAWLQPPTPGVGHCSNAHHSPIWAWYHISMDPKIVAATSLLVGFVTFLAVNRVISDPTFNPTSILKLPDLATLLTIPNSPNQTVGFSKLLSLNKQETAGQASPVQEAVPAKTTPKPSPAPVIASSPTTTKPPVQNTPVLPTVNKLEITQDQINSSINTFIPPGSGVENLQVKLTGGKIVATGKLTSPIPGDLLAEATLTSVEKSVVIKIQKASVGSLTIPSFLLTSLESTANETINSLIQKSAGVVAIKSVEVQEGKIVVVLN